MVYGLFGFSFGYKPFIQSVAPQCRQLQTIIDENLASSRMQRVSLGQTHTPRKSSTSSNESNTATRLSHAQLEPQGSMERDVTEDLSDSDSCSDHVITAVSVRTSATDEGSCAIS